MLNANLIHPYEFALEHAHWTGEMPLSGLDSRVLDHDILADKSSLLHVNLTGGEDAYHRPVIDMKIKGTLSLHCQRCLKPVPYTLDDAVRLVLFRTEEALDLSHLDENDESDGVVVGDSVNIEEWVEDQVLMAFPFSPKHEDCGEHDLSGTYRARNNPFAVLKDIENF